MSLLPCATFASPGVPFFAKLDDDVTFKNVTCDSVITDSLVLDGQTITADPTAIFLNGVPYGGGGGGGVETVTGTAPITVTGTVTNPVIGLNQSGLVQTTGAQTISDVKTFNSLPESSVVPTTNNQLVNKSYVDTEVASVTPATWSEYPATQDVSMGGFKLAQTAEVSANGLGYGLTLTSDEDINIEAATGDITITTGTLTINNPVNMHNNRITNLAPPIDGLDAVNKNYTDSLPADTLANVLLAGNSAGSSNINMNGQDITGVNDIVMTGAVPTISAPLSATLTVAGLGPTTIASGTVTTITAPDYVSIGSAGYTTIENLKITNSVIEKVAGEADLQYKNVSSIEATGQLNVTAAPFCYNSTDLNDKDFNVAGSTQIVANFSKTIGLYTAAGDLTLQVANGDLQLQSGTGNIAISTDGGDVVENLLSGSNHYIADTTSLPSNAATSILEIQSETKGIYIPRMTSVQRESISTPNTGLLVFDTTDSALYMYGVRGWAKVALTNASNELLQSLSGLDGGVRTYSLTGLSEVDTDTIKLNTIQPIAPLISSDVGVEAQLVWEGDILLKNNGNSAGTDVVVDSIPSAPSALPDVVAYDPATKKLYYQAAGGGPTPTLSEVLEAGNNAYGQIIMNGNSITAISQLQMSGSTPSLTSFSDTAELSINSLPTQTLNLYGTVNTFNALNLQGAALRLNGGGGAAGNLLVSSGGLGAPTWSTGLKYDAVRKVLYAG